jgi:hypothetical protein
MVVDDPDITDCNNAFLQVNCSFGEKSDSSKIQCDYVNAASSLIRTSSEFRLRSLPGNKKKCLMPVQQ